MAKFRIFKETPTQDLAFEGGDFVFVEDKKAVRQQVETNTRLSEGNWFLNLDEGINYAGEGGILGSKIVTPDIEAEFIDTIANTFGVVELRSIDFLLEDNTLKVNGEYLDEFSTELETIEIAV